MKVIEVVVRPDGTTHSRRKDLPGRWLPRGKRIPGTSPWSACQ